MQIFFFGVVILFTLTTPLCSCAVTTLNETDRTALKSLLDEWKLRLTDINMDGTQVECPVYNSSATVSVACDARGRIVQLSLPNRGISGTIPVSVSKLGTTLRYLTLSSNRLIGAIPQSFRALGQIRSLVLNNNSLSGSLDETTIALWQSLTTLMLSDNRFSGSLPTFTNNKNLRNIELQNNNMSGSFALQFCSNSSCLSLTKISLNNNNLSGTIPDFFADRCPNLTMIDFSSNHFQGTIPGKLITALPALQYLILSFNRLQGTFPQLVVEEGLPLVSHMVDLRINWNELSGLLDLTRYFELGWSATLRRLDADNVMGEFILKLPETINGGCALVYLRLDNTAIQGGLPRSLANCKAFNSISARNCSLQGTLPPEYGLAWGSSLITFRVTNNSLLTGPIPEEYLQHWSNIESFFLQNNALSGPVNLTQLFTSCLALKELDWSWNEFTGLIPPSTPLPPKIQYLHLSHAKFAGTIPSVWSDASDLIEISLVSNHVFGTLPAAFTKLRSLDMLAVADNSISGTIPVSWARGGLQSITILVLQGNAKLTGPVPPLMLISSPLKRLLTICDTGLCGSALTASVPALFCLDLNQSWSYLQNNPLQYISKDVPCGGGPPPIPGTNPTHTVTAEGFVVDDEPSSLSIADVTQVAQGITAPLSIVASLMSGADALDVQILAGILQSDCMRPAAMDNTKRTDDGGGGDGKSNLLATFTSPFAGAGSAAAVLGNISIGVVVFVVHLALVWVQEYRTRRAAPFRRHRRRRASSAPSSVSTKSLLNVIASPLALFGTTIAATVRFPNLTITLLYFFSGGIARAAVQGAAPATSLHGGGRAAGLDAVGIVVLLVACIWLAGLVLGCEVILYRQHIRGTGGGGSEPLQYLTFERRVFTPLSRWVLPRGEWTIPVDKLQSVGSLVNPFVDCRARIWIVIPLVNWVLQGLSSIPQYSEATCDALQALSILLLVGLALLMAVVQPHRVALVSCMTSMISLLTAGIVLAGLLYRRGNGSQASQSAVDAMTLITTFVILISKLLLVAVLALEKVLRRGRDAPMSRREEAPLELAVLMDGHPDSTPVHLLSDSVLSTLLAINNDSRVAMMSSPGGSTSLTSSFRASNTASFRMNESFARMNDSIPSVESSPLQQLIELIVSGGSATATSAT
ncbi:GP46-like surface antigen, putative [Bodo saltans]|uniref:GP46-like surface antigen, putative n=1 Tax=Bodo saltans TaxID=75058 RepID=A0A0S4JG17_BODSA|nr:GP46-like surface antigen, putative [Bodo saltans]|eukprot:CUG89130.1 GP46-like surface antigen, putative [Bodo saltans]